jgi:hypothetical protein
VKNTIRKFAWLALCGSAIELSAAPPVIGVARSWGAFFVNEASVPGSATVFDGTALRTTAASSNLNLTGGERVTLASNSAATVHPDRLLLDRGTAEFGGSAAYRVEARTLRVETPEAAARIRVGIDSQNHVLVSSLEGSAVVRTSDGRFVARVASGSAFAFSPGQAGAAATVRMSGVVTAKNGHYYLTDATTNLTAELEGPGIPKFVGKHVLVEGSTKASATVSDMQTVVVTSVSTLVAGSGATGAGAAGGLGTLAKGAIIGGTAAGGTLGGLAAAGTIGGSSGVSR